MYYCFFNIKYLKINYNYIHLKLKYHINFLKTKIFIMLVNINETKLIKLKSIFQIL